MNARLMALAPAFAFLLMASCGGKPDIPAPPPAVKVVLFKSELGRYSVQTPVDLSAASRREDTSSGTIYFFYNFGQGFAGQEKIHSFLAGYFDFPVNLETNGPEAVLDNACNEAVKFVHGSLQSQSNITLDGHPGREILGVSTTSGASFSYKWRIFLVGRRCYEFITWALTGFFNQATADAFLQSVRIEPPPNVPGSAEPVAFTSIAGRFSVLTPAPFTDSGGSSLVAHAVDQSVFMGERDGQIYAVNFVDSRMDVESVAPDDQMLHQGDGELNLIHGSLDSWKSLTFDGHPGREFSAHGELNGVRLRYLFRIVLAAHRIYFLEVKAPPEKFDPARAAAFFDSFKITGVPPDPAFTLTDFKSTTGSFSVRTPVSLSESSRILNTKEGPLTLHFFTGGENGCIFEVAYTDHSLSLEATDPAGYLDASLQGILTAANGSIISRETAVKDGHPCLMAAYTTTANGVTQLTSLRLTTIGARLYELDVRQPFGNIAFLPDTFLLSLKILPPSP